MKEFIVFGDYKKHYCAPRADFKIFDFVTGRTPAEAFQGWKEEVCQTGGDSENVFEEEVYLMEVEGRRWVFNLETGTLSHQYQRTEGT